MPNAVGQGPFQRQLGSNSCRLDVGAVEGQLLSASVSTSIDPCSEGCQVFHDVVAEGFNIDHLLIGPAGVFTVETKTWSKPVRGDARISYDGHTVAVAGWSPDRDPLVQARSQASWLKTQLAESTGRQFHVRPVVVFPGWYVEAAAGSQREVWVMEPKGLSAFLAAEGVRMEASDVKLAAFHLGRFICSVERQSAP